MPDVSMWMNQQIWGIMITKTLFSYTFNANLSASLLTGVQFVNVSIPVVLTDILVEVQPLADLPANVTVGYGYISADGTFRIAFTTPILYSGNTNIPMRVSVLR